MALTAEQSQMRVNRRIFVNRAGVRDVPKPLEPSDFVAVVASLSGGLCF